MSNMKIGIGIGLIVFLVLLFIVGIVAAVAIFYSLNDSGNDSDVTYYTVTCDVTVKNQYLMDPAIKDVSCSSAVGKCGWSLFSFMGWIDEGDLVMQIGDESTSTDYRVPEDIIGSGRDYQLSLKCIPEGTHNIKISLLDDDGNIIDEETERLIAGGSA